MPDDVTQLVDHLFRQQAGRITSTLTRIFGPENLQLAEDVVQEALLKALRQWPFRGVPDNPGGWILQVARNRAIDLLRRESSLRRKQPEIEHWIQQGTSSEVSGPDPFLDDLVRDDQLGMMFTCCHPAIPAPARLALTLKTVAGFGVSEIARAFLCRDTTIAQRLVRAKRKIREEPIPFQLPAASGLPERLDSVLEVVYLLFNEGYSSHQGDELIRRDLCAEALRLARLLADHPVTGLPRVEALAALLLFQASRLAARVDAAGELSLLADQDRSLWDRALIDEGLRRLEQAASGKDVSSYHLEAGIAACHAVAPDFESTDWPYILSLYDDLMGLNASPIVALNRAVAYARVHTPAAGIQQLDRIRAHPTMKRYNFYHACRGELYAQMGRAEEAADCFRTALHLTQSEPVRRFIRRKLGILSISST